MSALEVLPFLALCLAVSALGFKRLVYFVSLGYAFSIAGEAALAAVRYRDVVDVPVALQLGLLAAYGLRLGTYLTKREREPAYRRELAEVQQRGAGIGRGKQVLIWVGVAALYVSMFSPALFNLERLRAQVPTPAAMWAGLAVMALGLSLETLADWQKAAFKREQPERYCDVGLYRLVRCPNYLGEVVFWVGSFTAGLSGYASWGHWAAAGLGLVCIVLIMMGSTKRLEHKQDARYGERADYQQYTRAVPVLFPFVPVYSLKNVRVYLE